MSNKKLSVVSNDSEQTKNRPSHYVGIGASAGGLEAIDAFFTKMPPDSGLAFIVIQHLSPDYKSLMVELLSKKTEMTVLRAEDGMLVLPDHVYLIPPKKNLTIFHGKLILNDQDSKHVINLPIDIFLRSLAEDEAESSIGIILSGTGSDGTRGVRAIKEFGGMVMVQDDQSAKFDGMPRAAISTGVADFILPPDEMPGQLMAYVEHPYVSREKRSDSLMGEEGALTRIFAELRKKTKVDFTYYKPSTITRRLERRMTVNQINELDDYVRYMHDYPGEVMTLYRELLIGVTNFFRDPEAMQELMDNHLPQLLENAKNREVRFWVAGCSTGEEAYTLAILTKEVMEKIGLSLDVKIFATDVDRDAIISAGNGIYPESIAADLTTRLLGKYFYKKDENYQIARHIREMVVFAQHNLVKDPPFTNIDLISCRNLLIYLQPVLQQKVFEFFNFSLNPQGVLFLGSSETVGDMADYFKPLHQKSKIYQSAGKSNAAGKGAIISGTNTPSPQIRQTGFVHSRARFGAAEDDRLLSRFIEVLAKHYAPLAFVVTETNEIKHIVGETEGYLKIPSGRAVYDVSKMAVKELSIPMSTGIQKVFRTREEMAYTRIKIQRNGQTKEIRLRIVPFPDLKGHESLVAVFMEELEQKHTQDAEDSSVVYDLDKEALSHIRDLEQDLQFTKENLQATIEELETSNEELQATNEELLASNEELQSTNEELQSTNEELHTVNYEYQNKINELTELNNDVDNLLTNSGIGILMLDEDLEIRKYSPEAMKIFGIIENDTGRPITHLTHNIVDADPIDMVRKVQETNKSLEKEVKTKDGRYYLVRTMPYHISLTVFSGIVITFIEITDLRQAEASLKNNVKKTEDIILNMPSGLFVYRLNDKNELILENSNPSAEKLTGIAINRNRGRAFNNLWPNARKSGLTAEFMQVLETGKTLHKENFVYNDNGLSGVYEINAFKVPHNRLAVIFEDITEKKRTEMKLEESEKKHRTLFETMAQGVVYQNNEGHIISANPAAERILGLTIDQMMGLTSMDPIWKPVNEDGSELPGDQHPSMLALKTGKEVHGFIMGVLNSVTEQMRWIMVNAIPDFKDGEDTPFEVYTTFEDITAKYKLMNNDGE